MIRLVGKRGKGSFESQLDVAAKGREFVQIDCTSGNKDEVMRELSPPYIGPVECYDGLKSRTFERAWECAKVYPWMADADGNPGEGYFAWRNMMWAEFSELDIPPLPFPERTSSLCPNPLYAWWKVDGEFRKLGYIAARKAIYMPLYAKAVVETEAYRRLVELRDSGKNLMLIDFDGYNIHHPKYYSFTYRDAIHCPLLQMGHGFILAMLLEGLIRVEDGEVKYADGLMDDPHKVYGYDLRKPTDAWTHEPLSIMKESAVSEKVASEVADSALARPSALPRPSNLARYYNAGMLADSTGAIYWFAATYRPDIVRLWVPKTVVSIGHDAFRGCENLEEVVFEASDEGVDLTIKGDAFALCPKLRKVLLSRAVRSIWGGAFRYDGALTTLQVDPSWPGVVRVSQDAFDNCPAPDELQKQIASAKINVKHKSVLAKPTVHDKVQLWEGGPYWATTNIGAEMPEDFGYHFWWGDTVGYRREKGKWAATDGSWSNFSFVEAETVPGEYLSNEDNFAFLKDGGWITDNQVLVPEHDAAHVQWGGGWRMPTVGELQDLVDKCDWSWKKINGVKGFVVRGKGAYAPNSIFLPCAGYGCETDHCGAGSAGCYWSSVSDTYLAWCLEFDQRFNVQPDCRYRRDYGQSVRPVQGFSKS